MQTLSPPLVSAAIPSPFPEGWYFVASRKDIEKEKLIHKTWMGENIVAYCDESGQICVAEAFCPHLGSDLSPAAGGRVRDGRLVCPFHGYEFDATGACVATPYAPAPRYTNLRVFETREIVGMIFAWWGIEGREPQWHLPAETLDEDGWCDLDIRTVRLAGHPQETSENSVDLAHLRYIHGFGSVERIEPVAVDGPHLRSRFKFQSTRSIAKVVKLTFDLSADTHVYGLGYSFVDIYEHSIGMDLRLWVMATPIDGTLIDMVLASQVREIRKPNRWLAGLAFLPVGMRAPIMNWFTASQQVWEVRQDEAIWSRKRYQSLPRLCRSDGEITRFRRYCAQFYPDLSENGGPLS